MRNKHFKEEIKAQMKYQGEWTLVSGRCWTYPHGVTMPREGGQVTLRASFHALFCICMNFDSRYPTFGSKLWAVPGKDIPPAPSKAQHTQALQPTAEMVIAAGRPKNHLQICEYVEEGQDMLPLV